MKEKWDKIWQNIQKLIKPDSAYSWHSLFLIAIASWLTAWLANVLDQFSEPTLLENLIAAIGSTFFILGVSWLGIENKWKIIPWVTGALICFFILGDLPQLAIILWPIISGLLSILPSFFDDNLIFKLPESSIRLNNLLLLGTQLLISCWFQVYFITLQWLQDYPTILADDLSNSLLLIKIETFIKKTTTGTIILNQIDQPLRENLANQPWSQVQNWIRENKDQETLNNLIQKTLNQTKETAFWQFSIRTTVVRDGYDLRIRGIWTGLKAKPEAEYYSEKICQLRKVSTTETSELKCEPAQSFIGKKPNN